MRVFRRTAFQLGTGLVAMAMVAAACGGGGGNKSASSGGGSSGGGASPTSSGGCQGDPPNQIYNANSTGTPKTGGTLTVLGQGDVDEALDINIGYFTLDSLAYSLYNRSLYTYPSVHCQTFTEGSRSGHRSAGHQ